MTNNRRRPAPKPAPRPARPAEPGITAAWLSDLLAGRISVPPGEYTVPAKPAVRREMFLGAEVEITPRGYRVVKPAPSKAHLYPDWPEVPPCAEDAEPLAVDAVMPAVVDVLNAITARLEQLRDGGHPERADGVTEGEQAAWRAGLNRAIALTSSSALIASGVGQVRRDGA